ncbi:MAG: class I SAM-dependent methyltransferase [Thermoleophilia bacterium]
MQRIPEKELMDEDDQARAYAEADFEVPHDYFISLFQEAFPGLAPSGAVVDLGCGPGDISMRFARRYPGCVVHGVDGSETMLRLGARLVERAPELHGRVRLIHGYLPGPEMPLRKYGALISNSLLHHLDDPQTLWRAIPDLAEEGAPVFVMDLMRPSHRDEAARLVDLYMGDEPGILKKDFFNSLLAAYEPDEVRRQLETAGLGDFILREVSDRHLAVWGIAPGGGR